MTAIRIEDFGGMIPRRSARLLPPNFAQNALNCKLFSGELRGWNAPLAIEQIASSPNAEVVFRIPDLGGDIWFSSTNDNVHIQKGTLVNDAHDRYYWTEPQDLTGTWAGRPKMNTAANIEAGTPGPYLVGMPTPTAAPTMTVAPTGGVSTLTVTRAFVYTFVSGYGEESAPSEALTVTGLVDDAWDLDGMEVAIPEASLRYTTGATKRIYRTITGYSGQTNFFLVADGIPLATASWDVSATDDVVAFNSKLESTGWNEPPALLEGLTTHPNGFLVGYTGRDLYFSEPYRPHAWPAKYVLSCDSEIMGLGIVGNTIGIATKSNPYGCTGIHPSAMSLTKSTTIEPCLSKKGVVTLPNGIYYPSNNGIAWLNPVGAAVITKQLFTKEEWQNDFSPDTIQACRYSTRYLAFKDANNGFIFDPEEPRAAVVNVSYTYGLSYAYSDIYSGVVHFLSNNTVYEWDPSALTTPIEYVWRSRVFEFPKPLNMGAGILKFNADDLTTDSDYVISLQAINTTVGAAAPPLASMNSRGLNGVRKLGDGTAPTYVADMLVVNQYQSGAMNSSDMLDIVQLSSAVPVSIVAVCADGMEIYRQSVTKDKIFRLPTGFKAHTYCLEIHANVDVYSIAIAETPKELRVV